MGGTRAGSRSRPAARFGSALWAWVWLALAPTPAPAHPGLHDTIARLSERIVAAPDDQTLVLERGIAYLNDGQVAEALADFRRAETLGDPDRVALDLGVLFYRTGRLAEAREALTRWLARSPDDLVALDYRARAARDAGDARAALRDYEALFALGRPLNPGQWLSAAELLAKREGDGIPAALALLDRGMAAQGTIPQLQRRAIAWERERGDLAAALRRHDALAEALGRSPEWRVDRAELLLAQGRTREAKRELGAASGALAVQRLTPAHAALAARIEQLSQTAESSRAAPGAKETP